MTPALAEGSAPVPFQGTLRRLSGIPPRSLVALMLGIAALLAVAAAAILWSRTPDYKVLFTNVPDRDGGAILAALTQMNVPYKMSEGGGAILVPSDKVAETRLKLASQGLPKGGTVGFELMDNQKLGTTQFQEQVNYQRGLEGELAKSIQSLAAVAGARVHLAMPRPSVFMRDAEKPSASVVVQLHVGRTLDRAQVAGIVHLVASSVPELPVKNVSVVDENGNLLSAPVDNLNGGRLDAQQLAWVREVEMTTIKRIEDILEPVVGRGNARAQVTADMDFSLTESTAETYKPNQDPGSATVRSSKIAEQGTAAAATAQGVPGAASNQPGVQPGSSATAASKTASDNAKREATVNYEVDKTVKVTRAPMGTVKRLSAAVVVNHRKVITDGKPTMVPLAKEEMEQIQSLVKEAMGFQSTRNDSLNVANTAFTVAERVELPEVPLWKQPEAISMAKDTGSTIGLVIAALFIFFGVIRPALRAVASAPAPVAALPGPAEHASLPSPDGRDRAAVARETARSDPRVVANVVKSWVSGNE